MSLLLLENIDTLATFDEQRKVLKNAWLLINNNTIEAIGTGKYEGKSVNQRLDLNSHVVLPGLVNLHHHFFQALLRNIPTLQDVDLFPWLRDMYLLKSEVRDEELDVATRVNIAELLLSGCTTTVDHNYLCPSADLHHDTAIKAAAEMGIRYHHARGSHSLGQKDIALLSNDLLENEDNILIDTERLIKTYHDPEFGGMTRIENAPSAPFSVTKRVFIESIEMARRYGVGNHTHLAQSTDDANFMKQTFGMSSVEWAQELGWVGPDVWYAHATSIDDQEIAIIKRTSTGISHCPNSNMYTAANVCRVAPMLREGGIKIGLGVDGSAANNSSHMLREARNALLMQRAFFGADAISPTQALEIAILGGAMVLRRDDIGVLAPGKTADLIGVDLRKLSFAGGIHDPVAALIFCEVDKVDLSIVNGKIRVANGELIGVDLPSLIQRGNELAVNLVKRTEKRFGVALTNPVWRRAYPYDAR
ncbi:MAG: amidohydrolase family protein [Anaerolineae bacterium]|nr:amidohydrolase family protein [Anaerolineae bacterium]